MRAYKHKSRFKPCKYKIYGLLEQLFIIVGAVSTQAANRMAHCNGIRSQKQCVSLRQPNLVCLEPILLRLVQRRDSAIRRQSHSPHPQFQQLLREAERDNVHAAGAPNFSLPFLEGRGSGKNLHMISLSGLP
jgi:hypothetical protein